MGTTLRRARHGLKRVSTAAGLPRLVRVVRPDAAGKSFSPSPGETMLVSYPRSGNTWTRFVLANLVTAAPTDFVNLEDRIPDIYVSSTRHIRRLPAPRIIKSHEPYTVTYHRVVYIVRDPRDVAASYLRFLQRLDPRRADETLEDFAVSFLDGFGGKYFGSWAEHVSGWMRRQGDDDFLMVRYEDLLADTTTEIDRIARFCGLAPDAEELAAAIEKSSSETLRSMERTQAKLSKSLNFTDSSIPFIGPAREGAGTSQMDAETLTGFEERLGPLMCALGYNTPGSSA
jgi:hypothetical protein